MLTIAADGFDGIWIGILVVRVVAVVALLIASPAIVTFLPSISAAQ